MLDQMVPPRKPVLVLAQTRLHRTVLEDGVVDAGLVALQVGRPREGAPAVGAGEGFERGT